jgi:hypothetical protein
MILKGSQRGGARELARHLMNGELNEHVTVHELRGFISETLEGALEEADGVSRGTRCKQFLFSLSLNPPETADVPIPAFEQAIDGVEKRLGLQKCPRIVVFHEKNGRRHCHAVWSRIDPDRQQLHGLVRRQLEERQELQKAAALLRVQQQGEILRIQRSIAAHIGAATEPESAKTKEKPEKDTLAAEIARVEARLLSLSGDISSLQAALENNLLSEGMKAKIRVMIERAVTIIFQKEQEVVEGQKQKAKRKAEELVQMQAEYEACVQRYVELQKKEEEQQRQRTVNQQFYAAIMNMSYSLIGVPPHRIVMAVPTKDMFDERVYVRSLEQQSNRDLLQSILKPPLSAAERKAAPPQRPEEAVIELRQSVLQVKEALRRSQAKTATRKQEPHVAFSHKGQSTLHTPVQIRFDARAGKPV